MCLISLAMCVSPERFNIASNEFFNKYTTSLYCKMIAN